MTPKSWHVGIVLSFFSFFWCRLDLFVCAPYFFNFSNRESLWADKTIDQISNSLLPTPNGFSLPLARKLYMSNILLVLFFLFCFCVVFPPVLIVKKTKQKNNTACCCRFIQTRSRRVFFFFIATGHANLRA